MIDCPSQTVCAAIAGTRSCYQCYGLMQRNGHWHTVPNIDIRPVAVGCAPGRYYCVFSGFGVQVVADGTVSLRQTSYRSDEGHVACGARSYCAVQLYDTADLGSTLNLAVNSGAARVQDRSDELSARACATGGGGPVCVALADDVAAIGRPT